MELEIMALEMAIEDTLKQSALSPEIKRLILVEMASKMATESQEIIRALSKEVKKQDAESV